MDVKRSVVFLVCILVLSSLVIAQEYKMELSTIPTDKVFGLGETIQVKVTIYDSSNNLVNDQLSVVFEDIKGAKISEAEIQSNKFETVELTGEAIAGEGKIIATYKDSEISDSFFIKENEMARFEISDGVLKITNIGNTKYQKDVYITIGETTGKKSPEIGIGKSVTYRLVAPDGTYNIKVSDGVSKPLEIGEVRLTGTGKAIGALDEQPANRNPLTGGISPDEKSDQALMGYIKDSKFTYVFILVIFGAMILLAIERRYRKKV